MPLTTVDRPNCTKCGLCASACPAGIVVLEDGFPATVEKIEKGCIACGHCVAVCPSGALAHARVAPEDCLPLAPDWRSTPERVEQLVRGRRSTRRYRPEPVDRRTLARLLDIVRCAPTGMNTQSVRWLVILDPSDVQRLSAAVVGWLRGADGMPGAKGMVKAWEAGSDPVLRKAPHLVVAYGAEDDRFVPTSSAIALATLELAAPSFGLGTCWAGYLHMAALQSAEVQAALALPPGCRMHGAVMIGRPEFAYASAPARNPAQVTWRDGPGG